jgi:hypothetical protein
MLSEQGRRSGCGMAPDAGTRPATVIGRWGDDTALVRAADGETIEVPVPEHLRDSIDVGTVVTLLPEGQVDWEDSPAEEPTG